ncbi:hypothetical protein RHGRI_010192 [Rhododendron griersonianum]|uniref:Uncharacterized protein n=1 Tax=Rhododendron griersonianum TaxID=479676 RepID=A0AAV6KI87_9ERIC|nr:hypothetical protein RHGRI_010192 [Rhododendron griersonianum]
MGLHSGKYVSPHVKKCNGDLKPGDRRSTSSGPPLIYSGQSNTSSSSSSSGGSSGGGATCLTSSVSSPNATLYPTGNICPSGKVLKSNMGARTKTRPDKLGSGLANYGHGSIVRNTHLAGELGLDWEELKRAGNELYRKGNFVEALLLYDRAIAISPENAACRSNRAAALTMVGRLGEAVVECEEAVRLDPAYGRAHQRLASLYLRRPHGCSPLGQYSDPKYAFQCLFRSSYCRILIGGGTNSACKAEAFLKLHKLENADSSLSSITKLEPYPTSCSQTKFFGMLSEAYVLYVQAQVDMAFGRFENAVPAAEKACLIDFSNIEIAMLLNNVKLVIRARSQGKDLFDSGRFSDACTAYGEGLKYDLSSSVLYCNRAVCWSKLERWDESVEDCNRALKIQPNYTKALLRRAVSNAKLEHWAEAVRDYEILGRKLPVDNEVAESLLRAQVALKRLRLEEFNNANCTGELEEVSSLHRSKAAISSPGCGMVAEGGGRVGDDVGGGNTTALVERQLQV